MPSPDIVPFEIRGTDIDDLRVVTTKQVSDPRGTVRELYRESTFAAAGPPSPERIRQVNATWTRQGAVRGMHAEDMTKLVGVVHGEAFGAYVDIRPGSPTHGRLVTQRLVPGIQVLVPRGVANGFQAVSEGGCEYVYGFDAEWVPGMAGTAFTPLDEDLAIAWPLPVDVSDPGLLSAKDAASPRLREL